MKEQRLFSNRDLFALILPLFGEQLLTILVGMADSIMAAHVGEAAVSGVSLVDNVNVLVIYMVSAGATAGAVIAGMYLGKKREELASEAAIQLIWFLAVLGIIMTIATLLLRPFILHVVFGKLEPDVMDCANTYMWITAFSFPFIAVYYAGGAIFRTMGDSKTSLIATMIMNMINVIGNAIGVYVLKLGVEGVAVPTLLSHVCCSVIVICLLKRSGGLIRIADESGRMKKYRPDKKMIVNILKLSIPNAVENGVFQMGKIVMLSLVSTFGTYAIAANAVCNTLATLMLTPGTALNIAVVPVISRCIGAGDYKQVSYYTKKLILLAHLSFAVSNLLVLFFMHPILSIYNISPRAVAVSIRILKMYACFNITMWPVSFILPSVFRAAGDVKYSMVITMISMWIFRVGSSFLFGQYLGWGVLGVWISYMVDWIFRGGCFVQHYVRQKWRGKAVV